MKIKFTNLTLDALSLQDGQRQLKVWDSETTGLGLVLGPKGATFIVSGKRADGAWRQETIGARGEMTLPEAKRKAAELLGKVAGGQATPGDKRRIASASMTLREAIASKVANMEMMKNRPQSIYKMRDELLGPHMADLLDRPIRSFTALELRARHLKIAETSKHSANRILAGFRTVWNHLAKEAALENGEEWPVSPTRGVLWFRKTQENFRARRGEPIMYEDLPAWYATITKANKVLINLVGFLTGLRRNDVQTLRWDMMNLTREPIIIKVWSISRKKWLSRKLPAQFAFLPCPKGGTEKAFHIPLPQFLVDMLLRERERTAAPWLKKFGLGMTPREKDGGWVFPGIKVKTGPCVYCQETGQGSHVAGQVSHIVDPRQCDDGTPSTHRLRDTWLSTTPQIGMPEQVAKALVNHTTGDVTEGYRLLDPELLRHWQEKMCTFLLAAMRGEQQRHLSLVA